MRIAYLDASAAVKLVLQESERAALLDYLDDDGLTLASAWLLYTEMRCTVGRRPEHISADAAKQMLDQVELVDLARNDLIRAGSLAPLRSNDAIHLAVALRLHADEIITYDRELAAAAAQFGLRAIAPA